MTALICKEETRLYLQERTAQRELLRESEFLLEFFLEGFLILVRKPKNFF